MNWSKHSRYARIAVLALALVGSAAFSQETLKLAVGQRGNWDTSVPELGQRAGIFKKRALNLELVYTQGGGETQQAVISGSVDIGITAGNVGWCAPPLGLEGRQHGKIRVIARGNDIPTTKNQSVGFVIVNAAVLEKRK